MLTEKEQKFANFAGVPAYLKYKSFKLSACNCEPGTCAVFLGRAHLSLFIENSRELKTPDYIAPYKETPDVVPYPESPCCQVI
jgi:hypothetical protein